MAEEEAAWKAPYLSYETFTNFFDKKLGGNIIPPRIDTYFLDNYAGSVRPLLLAALKTIGLIGERNEVLPPLREAAQGTEARKQVFRNWAQQFYAEQLELAGQAATAQMLWESFAKHRYSGSTLRKAVVFYLALVEDLGLPNSPHFKAPRAQATSSPRPNKRPAPPAPKAPADNESPAVAGERKVIDFGDAGQVVIQVAVRWLDLPSETFVKLRQGIDELEALGTAATDPPQAGLVNGEPFEERAS